MVLGFIPDWQFSADPAINPYINSSVTMPAGQYQAGIYGNQGLVGSQNSNILARVRAAFDRMRSAPRGNCFSTKGGKCINGANLGFVMIDEGPPPLNGVFDSWAWQNRKTIAIVAGGLAVLSVGGGLLALLR